MHCVLNIQCILCMYICMVCTIHTYVHVRMYVWYVLYIRMCMYVCMYGMYYTYVCACTYVWYVLYIRMCMYVCMYGMYYTYVGTCTLCIVSTSTFLGECIRLCVLEVVH